MASLYLFPTVQKFGELIDEKNTAMREHFLSSLQDCDKSMQSNILATL